MPVTHLGTVPLSTVQLLIWETINIDVRSTQETIASPSNSTLKVCQAFYGPHCFQWPSVTAVKTQALPFTVARNEITALSQAMANEVVFQHFCLDTITEVFI